MRSKLIGVVLVASFASACGPMVVRDEASSLFNQNEYGTQASRTHVPVLVLGSAAGLDGAPLADAVVARMQGGDWPPHARFAAAPASLDDRVPYSYVMMFNGPTNVTTAALCARRAAPPALTAAERSGGGTVLVAGLCRYDEAVSSVTARAPGVAGPDDPMLRDLIVAAMLELTRTQGRQHNSSSDGKDKS